MPKFMVHDRWSNVLFLHWRVPPDLEPLLRSDCGDFTLDRTTSDGSAWVGLVLLTERNVGPPCPRSSLTCVTHHGVNVRTYVRGVRGKEEERTRGIHFSSLECDDRFTAFGANIFGMPYTVANINRRYILERTNNEDTASFAEQHDQQLQHLASANERDDFVDPNGGNNRRICKLSLSSARSPRGSSFFDLLFNSLYSKLPKLHGTDLCFIESPDSSKEELCELMPKESFNGNNFKTKQPYSVECEWERCPGAHSEDPELVNFFVERYFVYTRKYGLNWRGQVEHEPWPVEQARLKNLTISNICNYRPTNMQPLISYIARTEPDSVLFSPGVGPIEFNMLRPV